MTVRTLTELTTAYSLAEMVLQQNRGLQTQTEHEKAQLTLWPSCFDQNPSHKLPFWGCVLAVPYGDHLPTIAAHRNSAPRLTAHTPLEPRAAFVVNEDHHQSIPHIMFFIAEGVRIACE